MGAPSWSWAFGKRPGRWISSMPYLNLTNNFSEVSVSVRAEYSTLYCSGKYVVSLFFANLGHRITNGTSVRRWRESIEISPKSKGCTLLDNSLQMV